ncbi:hypothetical protein [Psychrobacillus phage Spoks]|nr:hypothetical protein [Psychrobacillus phage Spoks]
MIIKDNSIEYDTEFIDAALIKENRSSIERDILNAFNRLSYYYYARIRDCVNSRKCKKMKINTVRERLLDISLLEFTKRKTNLNEEQIIYILNYIEKNFPALVN